MSEVVYSSQRTGFEAGRVYRNPRFFQGPMSEGVTRVIVVGNWPKVAEAYRRLGIEVIEMDRAQVPVATTFGGSTSTIVQPVLPPAKETDETRAVVAIPDNYADLPWTAKEPGALTVRAIAASVSATPIINRKAAIEAIEAELARRADAKVKAEAAKQQSGAGPAADGE